jgi:transcriptional regulator with XRE-family HTH domain
VASQAGISAATLSRIETDKQNVDVGTLVSLSGVLGIEPATLLANSNGDGHAPDALIGALATMPPAECAQLIAESMKQSRRGRARRDALHARIDLLVAALDLIHEELLELRRDARRR